MNRLNSYFRLMRPVNCVMMGFAVLVGAALASPHSLSASWLNLIYGFITGFTLTAASMAINDYYDREIDAINEPNRPIPSGSIQPEQALVFAAILTAMGFTASYLTNFLCFLTAIVAWAIFVVYTTVGKRSGLPGNFLVSTCVAIPFVYGSIAVAGAVRLNVLFFVSMVSLSITGREITKGIADVQGDASKKIKTLAVRFGEKKAALAAAVFYVSAVLLSPVPWLFSAPALSFWYIPVVAVEDSGLLVSSIMLLKDHSRESAKRIKKIVLLWFLIGLLAFVVGVLG